MTTLRGTISDKDYRKFKLNTLLCVAERVAQFSHECGQCHMLQQDVTTLVQDASNLVYSVDKEERKRYQKSMDKIIEHLQKQHKLVKEGYYIGITMVIGSVAGVALGTALDNVGSAIPIGVGLGGLGAAIGAALDAKAKKEGRILCPKETTHGSKLGLKIAVILGVVLLLAGLVAFLYFRRSG